MIEPRAQGDRWLGYEILYKNFILTWNHGTTGAKRQTITQRDRQRLTVCSDGEWLLKWRFNFLSFNGDLWTALRWSAARLLVVSNCITSVFCDVQKFFPSIIGYIQLRWRTAVRLMHHLVSICLPIGVNRHWSHGLRVYRGCLSIYHHKTYANHPSTRSFLFQCLL